MATGDPPAVARRRLRIALRKAREAAGLTQGQVADALEWSISKVNRIETGEVTISNTDLQAALRLLEVADPEVVERHLEDARAARRKGWWNEPRYKAHHTAATLQLAQFETEATAIRTFQLTTFPGLLQTSDYSAAVIGAVDDRMSVETKAVRREVRMRRQAELAKRSDPPELLVVIDEFVPERSPGMNAVMADQIKALINAVQLPNVHIRMLPKDQSQFLLLGAFSIYDFGEEENAVLYRERAVTDDLAYVPEEILRYRRRFDQMWDLGLNEETTLIAFEARYANIRGEMIRGR